MTTIDELLEQGYTMQEIYSMYFQNSDCVTDWLVGEEVDKKS